MRHTAEARRSRSATSSERTWSTCCSSWVWPRCSCRSPSSGVAAVRPAGDGGRRAGPLRAGARRRPRRGGRHPPAAGGVVYTGGILYAGRRDPDPVGAGHLRGAARTRVLPRSTRHRARDRRRRHPHRSPAPGRWRRRGRPRARRQRGGHRPDHRRDRNDRARVGDHARLDVPRRTRPGDRQLAGVERVQRRRHPGPHRRRRSRRRAGPGGGPRLGSRAAGRGHGDRRAGHAHRGTDRSCGRRPVRRCVSRVPRLALATRT